MTFTAETLVAVTTNEALSTLLFVAPLKHLPMLTRAHDAVVVRCLSDFARGARTAEVHGNRAPLVGAYWTVYVTPLALTGWSGADPETLHENPKLAEFLPALAPADGDENELPLKARKMWA